MNYQMLSDRRREIGMSIDELVNKSGVPKGTVTKIITGVTENPGIETLKAITYALGLTLEDLDKEEKPADVGGLDGQEERFVWLYRQLGDDGVRIIEYYLSLSPSNRRLMLAIVQAILQEQDKQTSPVQ